MKREVDVGNNGSTLGLSSAVDSGDAGGCH